MIYLIDSIRKEAKDTNILVVFLGKKPGEWKSILYKYNQMDEFNLDNGNSNE